MRIRNTVFDDHLNKIFIKLAILNEVFPLNKYPNYFISWFIPINVQYWVHILIFLKLGSYAVGDCKKGLVANSIAEPVHLAGAGVKVRYHLT